jgi:hypothetical protein
MWIHGPYMLSKLNPIIATLFAVAMFALGMRLIRDAYISKKTGFAHMVGQISAGFDRQIRPIEYWLCVSLATISGCFFIAAAIIIAHGIALRLSI